MDHRSSLERAGDELAHIEDTLRSELLIFPFEHLTPDCSCRGKTCSKCHLKQCHLAFPSDKRKRDGLYSYCRECRTLARAQHRHTHPEMECVKFHNYRARQKQVVATLTAQEWLDLKARYDFRCLCCGKQEPETKLTLDHVIPISQGGTNTVDNVQPLCPSCNFKKGTQITDYRL